MTTSELPSKGRGPSCASSDPTPARVLLLRESSLYPADLTVAGWNKRLMAEDRGFELFIAGLREESKHDDNAQKRREKSSLPQRRDSSGFVDLHRR